MTDYTCAVKTCPNEGIVFTWDNADDGVVCRSCGMPMSVLSASKPATIKKAKADD